MITRAVAALAVGLGLAVGAATAPAAADPSPGTCPDVTVVVDYNELGGETRTGCVPPGTAADAFDAAGIDLEYLPHLGGFVCRVTGVPADGPCSDGDAYWSLWWSDGTTPWSYASLGVGALEVPAGGTVGFAWHEGAGDAEPPDGAAPGAPEEAAGSDAAPSSAEESASPDGGVPAWALVLVAGVVLLAAAVPVTLRRRRS